MDSIESLCLQIKNENKCPFCKGSFHMDVCIKCGYKSLTIKKYIEKLLPLLNQNISSEQLLNLYTLKSLGYDKINMLLSLSGVEDYLKNKEEKILNQTRYELSDERLMLYFIENDFPNKNEMINRLIKEMLSNNLDLQIEEKLLLFKYFVEFIMSNNFKCEFTTSKVNNLENVVIFNENDIKELFYQNMYLDLLELAFRKCYIVYQNSMLNSTEMSPLLIKIVKEKLISEYLPNYYDENKYAFSIEVGARYNANILLRNYISSLGFKMSNMLLKVYDEKLKNDFELLNSNIRFYKGRIENIDSLFIKVLSKIQDKNDIFKKYPALFMEYGIKKL